MLIVFIIGIVLLKETFTVPKLLGVLSLLVGGLVLTWKGMPFGRVWDKGIQLVLLSAVFRSIGSVIDKVAMGYFSQQLYGFIEFLIPSLAVWMIAKAKIKQMDRLIKRKGWWVLLSSLLVAVDYYCELSAFKLMEVSVSFPLFALSQVLIVIGGITLLGERDSLPQKILGTIFMIAGGWLLV